MYSSNFALFSSSFTPLSPSSSHFSTISLSPSHQHRLLLVSRAGRHCPKAESTAQGWVWASASSPHPPLFKHLPASENIPHCLSSRDGGDLSQNVSIAKDNTLENGLKKYFVLNCGWVGVKSPKLFSDKTVSCSYGIFDHSKHMIFSWIFLHFSLRHPPLQGWSN